MEKCITCKQEVVNDYYVLGNNRYLCVPCKRSAYLAKKAKKQKQQLEKELINLILDIGF